MTTEMAVSDLFLRVELADGKTHFEHRRVWDAAICIDSVQAQYRNEDKKEKREPTVVTIATRAEYEANRRTLS